MSNGTQINNNKTSSNHLLFMAGSYRIVYCYTEVKEDRHSHSRHTNKIIYELADDVLTSLPMLLTTPSMDNPSSTKPSVVIHVVVEGTLSNLPNHLLILIAGFYSYSPKGMATLQKLSSKFKKLFQSDEVWQHVSNRYPYEGAG